MNKNTIFAAVIVIVILPFIYLVVNALRPEPLPSFAGREVVVIDPGSGTIVVPSEEEAKKGKPLTANYTKEFVERVTSKKMTNTKGLNLTLNTVEPKIQNCEVDGSVPARGGFDMAQLCGFFAFEKSKEPKKTSFFIAPEEKLMVFGKSGQNHTSVYHNGMVATFDSADMTQSDRKHEACLVRMMMDYTLRIPAEQDNPCRVK